MKVDERKIPSILAVLFFLVILIIAFLYNFIPGKIFTDENVVLKGGEEKTIGRSLNVYYINSNDFDKKNQSSVLYVNGNVDLSDNLKNNVLIELHDDTIYNVKLPNNKSNLILRISNNTETIKNIRCNSRFFINEIEKGRMITLKQKEIIVLHSNDSFWNLISSNNKLSLRM